jgi:predicted Zn-dependent protease
MKLPREFLLAITVVAFASSNSIAAENAHTLIKQGEALLVIGATAEARQTFRKALELKPSLSKAQISLAYCLWREGKTKDALQLLNSWPGKTPAAALYQLADIHWAEGNFQAAATAWEKLHARGRLMPAHQLRLARCYEKISQEDNPKAKNAALKILNRLGKSRSAEIRRQAFEHGLVLKYGEVGKALVGARNALARGQARRVLKQLRTQEKQQTEPIPYLSYLIGRACLDAAVSDRDCAMRSFEKSSGIADASFQLGVLHYEDGDLEKSSQHLQAAIRSNPYHQASYYHLGLFHREEGNDKKAIRAWKKAIRLSPKTAIADWARTKMQVLQGRVRIMSPGQIIDPATEISLGKKTCKRIEKKWKVLKDEKLELRMEKIMNRLLKVSDRPRRDLRYKIAILDVPVVNAVTVPNGKIYIFKGLVDLIRKDLGDSEDAYAAVIAHELSHNALRHGAAIIKMASSYRSFDSMWQLGRLIKSFNRSQEYEADQYGTLYAYRAGYNPSVSITLQQKMMKHKGELPPGMTHPRYADRIRTLRSYLLELRSNVRHFKRATKALKSGNYDNAIDHLELFLGVFPDSASARNNLAFAIHRKALLKRGPGKIYRRTVDLDPDAHIRTIKLRSSAPAKQKENQKIDRRMLNEAIAEYQLAIQKSPTYWLSRINLAAALSDLGQPGLARKHLKAVLSKNPKSAAATNNLGVLYAQKRQFGYATVEFRRAVTLKPDYQEAQFNLALALEDSRDGKAALNAWRAYLDLDPLSGWARIAKARMSRLNTQ